MFIDKNANQRDNCVVVNLEKVEKNISIRVYAGAKKEKIRKAEKNQSVMWNIYVREPALKNMANKRVREILGAHYKIPIGNITILTGHKSPKKRIKIVFD
jgi:uncharacterized protein YggU (UPF0235/DUF167 family)